MKLTVFHPHGSADVSLAGDLSGVEVRDIVETLLGEGAPHSITADGRPVLTSSLLEDTAIGDGSVIDLRQSADGERFPSKPTERWLVQVAGPQTGYCRRLNVGRFALGPARVTNGDNLHYGDVKHHAAVVETDLEGSVMVTTSEGTIDGAPLDHSIRWEDGLIAMPHRVFRMETRRPTQRPLTPGSPAFNRQPRQYPDDTAPSLELPEAAKDAREARKFPLIAMIAPIPLSVMMAVVTKRYYFLAFALMSPMMAAANWYEDRRTRKRELEEKERLDEEAAAEFREQVVEKRAEEIERRRKFDPDMAEMLDRARCRLPSLWEVRPTDNDAYRLSLGLADITFDPERGKKNSTLPQVEATITEVGPLASVPAITELGSERGVAVVGERSTSVDALRAMLLQLCIRHGPADLTIVVVADPEHGPEWDWVKWLPHARTGGSPMILTDPKQVSAWATEAVSDWEPPRSGDTPGHLLAIIADGESWWRNRDAPLRPLLSATGFPVRLFTLAPDSTQAPALCTTVLDIRRDGTTTMHRLLTGETYDRVTPFLVDGATALESARAMAGLEDPERPMESSDRVPNKFGILSALEIEDLDQYGVAGFIDRWASNHSNGNPFGVIGAGANGAFSLDMVSDGPHGLIAGTTGSGKSELLKSLVVSMAANHEPDRLNFVLVDFKGGAAFDACSHLPHTVGLVTDLDDHLTARVLRCLKAELTFREHRLRDAEVTSLDEYVLVEGLAPLPRLILIVDEFAALAAEFPDFLPSLVDIAQRGRSLGFHMILATQRPAGVVDNKIKANTNLRIALRVQDDGDSMDVINTKDAAHIPRANAGRAYVRLGAGELTPVQTAYSMAHTMPGDNNRWSASPFVATRPQTRLEQRIAIASQMTTTVADGEPDLDRLVGLLSAASEKLGQSNQRQPYPDPLPGEIPLASLEPAPPGQVAFALEDLPDEQRQATLSFDPREAASMMWVGIPGSGTSTLLTTIAASTALAFEPSEVHIYVIDADTNLQAPLAQLPHVGAVLSADEPERLARLITHLRGDLEHRRNLISKKGPEVLDTLPTVIIMVDNVGALRDTLANDRQNEHLWPELERLLREGPSLRMMSVLTAAQERALPSSLASQIPRRFAMRLPDPMAYMGFGLRKNQIPTFVPGRAVLAEVATEVQVAVIGQTVEELAASLPYPDAGRQGPKRIDPLPSEISVDQLVRFSTVTRSGIEIAVGIDVLTAEPAKMRISFGETAFVTGAPGSGRSSTLAAIALGCQHADPDMAIFALAPRPSPLTDIPGIRLVDQPAAVSNWVDEVIAYDGPLVVLIDDADRIGGPSLDRLAGHNSDRWVLVASGRNGDLRNRENWSRPLQKHRNGLLIRPVTEDGELVKTSIGFRLPRYEPHRGILVNDGELTNVLAASMPGPAAEVDAE